LLENKEQKDTKVASIDITAQITTNSPQMITQKFGLLSEINWIVDTPILIELSEGIVQNVQTREQLLLSPKYNLEIGIVR
jgi:hypothetical protein